MAGQVVCLLRERGGAVNESYGNMKEAETIG